MKLFIKVACISTFFAVLIFVQQLTAQTVPVIMIDGSAASALNLTGSPFWLKEGQSLAPGNKVSSVSVLQYIIAPSQAGGSILQFESVVNVTTLQNVPTGKVWKIESAAIDPTASSTMGDNLGNHVATTNLNMSNFKINNMANPSSLNDGVNATTAQQGNLVYAVDNGTANNYSVTLSPAPVAYSAGMIVNFKVANANTGASTINVNSLGVKNIKKQVNVDLIANELAPNQLVSLIYDGTNFQMLSPVATSSGLGAANVFNAASWQSSNTSSNWENITTISYTIPQTGLYQVICSYESEAGTGGTQQYQRLLLGSYIGNQASVVGSGYQFRTISNMANLTSGSVIYLQNQNDWNYGYKNTVKNIQFSLIKLN